MGKGREGRAVVARWCAIPGEIRKAVRGLPEARLDDRADADHMSYRQTVHHLVEANLIASNIVLAALARSGMTYDWSWVYPNAAWMRKLAYDRAPVGPPLALLTALCAHLSALLAHLPDGLERKVRLFDAPGSKPYTKTVAQILADEVSHARTHLEELPRRAPRRRPPARRDAGRALTR